MLALRAPGPAFADMADLVDDLRGRGADVAVVSEEDGAALPLPPGVPEASRRSSRSCAPSSSRSPSPAAGGSIPTPPRG